MANWTLSRVPTLHIQERMCTALIEVRYSPYTNHPEIYGRLHAVTIQLTFGNAENVEANAEVEVDVPKKFELRI